MALIQAGYSATKKHFAVDWSSLKTVLEDDTTPPALLATYSKRDQAMILHNRTSTLVNAVWYRKQKDKPTREDIHKNSHTTSVFCGEVLLMADFPVKISSKEDALNLTESVGLFPRYRLTEHGEIIKYREDTWAWASTIQSTFRQKDLHDMSEMFPFLTPLISNPGTFPDGYDGWLAVS